MCIVDYEHNQNKDVVKGKKKKKSRVARETKKRQKLRKTTQDLLMISQDKSRNGRN